MTDTCARVASRQGVRPSSDSIPDPNVLRSLRQALLIDAVISGTFGVVFLLGADPLNDLFDLSSTLIRIAGISFIPFVLLLGYLSTREAPSRMAVWTVICMNLSWTVASLTMLVSGWVSPSTIGLVFVVAQAMMVGWFAVMQLKQVRRL